jgi:hypothetical protein
MQYIVIQVIETFCFISHFVYPMLFHCRSHDFTGKKQRILFIIKNTKYRYKGKIISLFKNASHKLVCLTHTQ